MYTSKGFVEEFLAELHNQYKKKQKNLKKSGGIPKETPNKISEQSSWTYF